MKSRNTTATDPRLQKGHAHKSKKDYNRKEEKKKLKEELSKGGNRKK
jgi:hypothetical protein